MTASTPAASSRASSSASSTVHAQTATPAACARAIAAGETTACWSISARAPVRVIIAGTRTASARRSASVPSRIAGFIPRRFETPYRSSGYVKPIVTGAECAATARRLGRWKELTTERSTNPCRSSAFATSSSRHRPLRQLRERVADQQRPVRRGDDVELDRIDTLRQRRLERLERVLRREQRRAAMTDADHRPVSP